MSFIRIAFIVFALLFAETAHASTPAIEIRRLFIGISDFSRVGNTYFQKGLSPADQAAVQDLIRQAKQRITTTFGSPIADPRIIIVSTEESAKEYGLNDTPAQFFFSWAGNYLVIDKNKSNIDVIAHEFTHAEIANRLGYAQRTRNFATWLDEGIALQIDHRPEYEELRCTESEMRRVQFLKEPSEFWSTDHEQNIKNYQAAKCAVHNLFEKIPIQSLYSYLGKIHDGEKYTDVLNAD